MSEYLSKKAVLESIGEAYQTDLESPDQTDWDEGYRSALRFMKRTVQSGAFDAPEMEHINTYWAREGLIKHQEAEVQRLRAAAIKLHETLNTYWQGDCEKADVVVVQSKLCDVLGADRDDELYGDWTDERCPKCGANLLGNKVGDKWCSLVGCDYDINAKEKVGTEEWRHKYFGAEWPKAEGDGNDA